MTVSNEQLRLLGKFPGWELIEDDNNTVLGLNNPKTGFIQVENQLWHSPKSGKEVPIQSIRFSLRPGGSTPYPLQFHLNDPSVRFHPEGYDSGETAEPQRALLVDKEQRTVVFHKNGEVFARLPDMPHFVQD